MRTLLPVPVQSFPVEERASRIHEALALIRSVWPTWLMEAGAPDADSPATDWSVLFRYWPHLQLLLYEDDRLIGVANSIPLCWNEHPDRLPDEGWDWAYGRGLSDRDAGRAPHTLCALAVTLAPSAQGRGLSAVMLAGLKKAAQSARLHRLIAPVRPNQKHRLPHLSMQAYLHRRTASGLPADPWLRTHVRMDARVVRVCPRSMQLAGRLEDWERWLSVSLSEATEQAVPSLLSPLQVDRTQGVGRYTEPNVWVEHPMTHQAEEAPS